MSSIHINPKAYLKAILHAAKYPTGTVLGLVLGEITKKDETLYIQDALPLFHTHPIGPMLELSLMKSEVVARHSSPSPLVILGIYVASDSYDKKEIPLAAQKVANKIAELNPLAIDNTRIAHASKPIESAIESLTFSSGRWSWSSASSSSTHSSSSASSFVTVDDNTLESTYHWLVEEKENEVCDFEDHIQDVTKDWRNPSIHP